MDFTDLHRRMNRVINSIDSIVLEAAMEEKEAIADLNVQQLESGKRNDGKSIVPEYQSDAYAQFKKSIGSQAPIGTPDLKLTGDFYRGIYAKKQNGYIYTFSSDAKAEALSKKYPKILGLDSENLKYLQQQIKPAIVKKINHELQQG